jgi:ribosomal protein S18 acetylase RimI-like enzyme
VSQPVLRRLEVVDLPFLQAMFVNTICWRPDLPRRSLEELLAEPELSKYIVGWGRRGDAGVVAVSTSGERLGAAWYRLFSDADHGYGFVSSETPELGIAAAETHRGRGLGTELLRGLIQVAREEGHSALSLSVEEDNIPAVKLYARLAFQRVERIDNSWTMLLRLKPPAAVTET